ncbi:MAG: ATP-binding protein, partial [Campylobacterota bacterium]
MEDLNRFEIKLKKLDYIYENLLGGLIGIFGLSTIIYFTFNGIVDSKNLTTWFILNIVLVLMRLFLLKTYKKSIITSNNYLMYYILFFVLAVLNAMVWGMGAFYILPADLEYQLVLLLLVAGLTAGSTISLASEKEMFYMYLFFTMTPFIYVFYIGDSTATKIVSVSMTLWVVILILTVRKISKSVINNMLLAYENKNLIIQLEEKVEEANIANRAKSEFLSVMSHEIRTPLNAILGFVHILKEKEEDTKKREYLDIIDKSSVVLTKVINDILDLTKIESEKLTLEMIEFSPKTEFNSVYSLFEQNSIEKGVIFINSISNELPEFVKSDIVRIKQILSNLISNAIKFTTEGNRVELKINFNDDKSLMCFEIIDEGIGIPKEDVETITEPFMQADSSVTRKYGGTGLGLSIVANLLRLLGSELKIESEVDKGSKFSFELEVSKVETIKEDEDKFVEDSFEGKRIL